MTFVPAGFDQREYRAVLKNCADRTGNIVSSVTRLCSLVSGSVPPLVSTPASAVSVVQASTASATLVVGTADPVAGAVWARRLLPAGSWTVLSGAVFNATNKTSSFVAVGASTIGLYEYYANMTNCAGPARSNSFFVCSGSLPTGLGTIANQTVGLGGKNLA